MIRNNEIVWVKKGVLAFGDLGACSPSREDWAVVHACKSPCHKEFVGYKGSLDDKHPQYLVAEARGHLYLNMIDPPLPLFKIDSFYFFFNFVDEHLHKKPMLIHCNQGLSRAPSLALLVMAKRLGEIPDESYAAAKKEFEQRFPYHPGKGISQFLEENWEALGR